MSTSSQTHSQLARTPSQSHILAQDLESTPTTPSPTQDTQPKPTSPTTIPDRNRTRTRTTSTTHPIDPKPRFDTEIDQDPYSAFFAHACTTPTPKSTPRSTPRSTPVPSTPVSCPTAYSSAPSIRRAHPRPSTLRRTQTTAQAGTPREEEMWNIDSEVEVEGEIEDRQVSSARARAEGTKRLPQRPQVLRQISAVRKECARARNADADADFASLKALGSLEQGEVWSDDEVKNQDVGEPHSPSHTGSVGEAENEKSYMQDTDSFSSKRRPTVLRSKSSFVRSAAGSRKGSVSGAGSLRARLWDGMRGGRREMGEMEVGRVVEVEKENGNSGSSVLEGGKKKNDERDEGKVEEEEGVVDGEREDGSFGTSDRQPTNEDVTDAEDAIHENDASEENAAQEEAISRPQTPIPDILPDIVWHERDLKAAIRRKLGPHKTTKFRRELEHFRALLLQKTDLPPLVDQNDSLDDIEVTIDAQELRQGLLYKQSTTFLNHIERLKTQISNTHDQQQQIERDCLLAQKQIPNLEAENESLEKSISNSKDEIQSISANPEVTDDHRKRSHELKTDIKAMQFLCASSLKAIEMYKNVVQTTDGELEELVRIRAGFKALLEECIKHLIEVEKERQAGEEELTILNQTLKKEIDRKGRLMRSERPIGTDRFEQKYEDKKVELLYVREQFNAFRRRMAILYKPELAREHERLKRRLVEAEEQIGIVQAERDEAKTMAAKWEREYYTTHEEGSRRLEEAHREIEELKVEMLRYVKEYHDNLPVNNTNYWEVRELQIALADHETELAQRRADVERCKTKVKQWQTAFKEQNMAFEILREEGIEKLLRESREHQAPRYMCPSATAARNKTLRELRKQLAQERWQREATADLVEKTRKHILKKQYPPRRADYAKLVSMHEWERWDVNKYLQEAPSEDRETGAQLQKKWELDMKTKLKYNRDTASKANPNDVTSAEVLPPASHRDP